MKKKSKLNRIKQQYRCAACGNIYHKESRAEDAMFKGCDNCGAMDEIEVYLPKLDHLSDEASNELDDEQ